ncbi:MAG TPA: HepT-like ribonuclease domain-containing protein [Bryobacteraceae bacterium]|nr:HepT-like ribonuclease domain-containing protein [Bryobacteraceae bacterium]
MSDDTLYLEHIIERCERVARSIASGRDEFYDSEEKQDAIIRNIEVIGEAAREAIASVDWRAVCGMRDVLIHN